jgi:hypothetical protein
MIGIGNFAKDGAGPNICATYKPPMAGDTGVSVSTMEGKLEITAKKKLKIEAGDSIKINVLETVDIKAVGETMLEGSSAAKITSSSPSNYDAPLMKIL